MIATTDWCVNLTGIVNHQLQDLQIVTAGGVCSLDNGKIIFVMHQYTYKLVHQKIHFSMQVEHFGIQVNDR